MEEQIRIDVDGYVTRIKSYAYVPWEMHGMRGALLVDGSPRRPFCSTYILDCGKCPPADVARGCHAFPVQWVHYATPLDRVWSINEGWEIREA